jgi:hypothetical protein
VIAIDIEGIVAAAGKAPINFDCDELISELEFIWSLWRTDQELHFKPNRPLAM